MAEIDKDGALGAIANIDSSGAVRGSKEYVGALNEMEKATDKAGKSIDDAEKAIDNIGKSVEDAAKSFSSLEEATKHAEKLQEKIDALESDIEKFASIKADLTLNADVEGAETYAKKISEAVEESIRLGEELQATQQAIAEMNAAMEAQNQAVEKSVSLTKEQEDAFAEIKDVVRDYSQTAAHLIALTSGKNKGLISEEDTEKANEAISAINRLKKEFDRLASLKSSPEEFAKGLEEMEEVIKKITSDDSMNAFLEEIFEQKRNITEETEKNNEESSKGADKEKEAQTTIRAELRKTVAEIMALNYALSQMNDEELSSDAAEEMKERLAELTEQASEMTRALKKTNASIKEMSSESRAFDAISQGVDTVISGFGGLIAVQGTFAEDQEELIEIQTKLQSVLTASNAIKTVQNNLSRKSALLLGIEAAQTNAAAVATKIKTAAEGKGVVVTKMATLAQKAFNAVAKANPYVILATALLTVVGAVSAYVIGTKKAREEEKKHQAELKRTAEAQKAAAKAAEERQKAIAGAAADVTTKFLKLQSEWKNLKTVAEKKEWIKNSKSGFDALGLSINKISTAEKVFISQTNDFVKAMAARAIASAKAALAVDEYIKFVQNKPKTEKKFGNLKAGDSYAKISDEERLSLTRQGITGTGGKLSEKGAEYLMEQRRKKALDASLAQSRENNKKEKELKDSVIKAYNEELEASQKLAQMGDKPTNEKSDKTTKDKAKEQQAYNDALRKQTAERIRKEKDAELQAEQYRIDAMENSSEKTRAQIWLNFRKENEAIKRAYEDLKNTKIANARALWEKDPKNKKAIDNGAVFDESSVDTSLTYKEIEERAARIAANQVKYNRAMADLRKADLESANEYFAKYGTIEQQREAIISKYDQLIENATDKYKKSALMMEKDDALEKLSSKDIFNDIDWDGVFGELEGHTENYLKSLRDQLRELLDSDKLSDITDIEKVQQKISELNTQIARKGGIFSFRGEYTEEQQRLRDNLSDANDNLARAIAESGEAGINIEALKAQGLEGTEKMAKAEADLEKARQKVADATIKVKQAEDALHKTLSDKIVGIFKTIEESKAFENINELPNLFDKLGLTDESQQIQKGIDGFNDLSGAAKDFAQHNYIGAISKSVSAVTNFGEALGLWSNSNSAEIEDANKKLEAAMSVNTEAINRLTSAMEKQNPEEAAKSYKQAVELLRINEKTEQNKMYNNAKKRDGGHSLWADFWDNGGGKLTKDIYTALGKNYTDEGLATMVKTFTASDWNKLLTDYPELMRRLGEKISESEDNENYNGLFKDILQFANDYSDDTFDELAKKFQESVTNVSFDTLYDNFVNSLMDMDKSAQDFSNDFEGYLRNAIYQAMAAEKVKPMLERWMKGFEKAMESREANGKYLSEKEINELMETGGYYFDENGKRQDFMGYKAITEAGMALKDGIEELGLYNGKNDPNQEATANGIEGITADQADQLIGRITAMQIAVEAIKADQADNLSDIKESALLVQGDVSAIKGYIEEQNGYISEIVDIQYESNRYLHDIRKHTAHLETIAEDINVIKKNTERL